MLHICSQVCDILQVHVNVEIRVTDEVINARIIICESGK